MKRNEVKILKILILVIITVGFYVPVSLNISDIKHTMVSIEKYSNNISIIQKQIEQNSSQIETFDNPNYDIQTLSETADLVLKEMNKYQIIPERYQLNESNGNSYIDFIISCSTLSFISYITGFEKDLYPYTLKNTTISTTPGMIKANLRFTNEYCTLITSNNLLNKDILLNSFPKTIFKDVSKTVKDKKVIVINTIEEKIIDGNSLFKSLGFIEENNTKYLFVKTIETGKIYKINSLDIEKEEDSYIIKIDNKKYKLSK